MPDLFPLSRHQLRFDAAPGAGPSGMEALQALPMVPSHSPSPSSNMNGGFNQNQRGGDLLDLI